MQLAVRQRGSGPRTVLIHGVAAPSRETWPAQRLLAQRWTLVEVDRPGHGESPGTCNDFLLDADLLVDQVLTEPSHVVGYSYGGIGAMLAAVRAPEQIRTLTVVEPPVPQVVHPSTPAVEEFARGIDTGFGPPVENAEALIGWFFPFAGVPIDVPSPLPPWLERGARAFDGARPPTQAELPLATLAEADFPILVVSGGHHPVYEAICDTIASATGATRAVASGMGHLVPATGKPFNDLLEDLWTTAEASGRH